MTEPDLPRIHISTADLNDPKIEDIVAQEQALRRPMPTSAAPQKTPWYLSSVFYTTVAGTIGAFLGWALLEPFFEDGDDETTLQAIAGFLMLPVVGGMTGLLVGGIEGFMSRNYVRGLLSALTGFGVAFGLGLVSTFGANILFGISIVVAAQISRSPDEILTGKGLFAIIVGRSMAWAIAGMTVALGPGIALKSRKLTFNGFLGGMLGGAVGGLFFDPIARVISGPDMEGGGEVSRAIGFTIVGGFAGLFVGLVEHFAKEAWLQMIAGPLAGKQFIVYKDPTVLGSSPKCEIYLFKDAGIEPRHAGISKLGLRYEIEDYGTPGGTLVNGMPVKRRPLQDGDRIVLGETVLIFSERRAGGVAG